MNDLVDMALAAARERLGAPSDTLAGYGVDDPPHDGAVALVVYYRDTPPRAPDPFDVVLPGAGQVRVEPRVVVLEREDPLAPTPLARDDVTFAGLRPGAPIAVALDRTTIVRGGVCALVTGQTGARRSPEWLVTCGHIFPPRARGLPVVAALPGGSSVVVGTLALNLLERDQDLAPHRLDIAFVELTDVGIEMAFATRTPPVLVGVAPPDAAMARGARAYRPTLLRYSKTTETTAGRTDARVTAPLWPGGFEVRGVLKTRAAITAPGDSGTVLVAAPAPEVALGACTGHDFAGSLFEPLARALEAVAPRFGRLTTWSPS